MEEYELEQSETVQSYNLAGNSSTIPPLRPGRLGLCSKRLLLAYWQLSEDVQHGVPSRHLLAIRVFPPNRRNNWPNDQVGSLNRLLVQCYCGNLPSIQFCSGRDRTEYGLLSSLYSLDFWQKYTLSNRRQTRVIFHLCNRLRTHSILRGKSFIFDA